FRKMPKTPDTVLMGSSLMMAALYGADADYLNHEFDWLNHKDAVYLTDKIKQQYGETITAADFAIGGEMVSEAYAILAGLLSDQNMPKKIIWGIAIRDFLDDQYSGLAESEIASYMTQISGKQDLLPRDAVPYWQRAADALLNSSSIYTMRGQLIARLRKLD